MAQSQEVEKKKILLMESMYLDRQVVIAFNNYEVTGKLIKLDKVSYHLFGARVTHYRKPISDNQYLVTEHQALTVGATAIFIGIA